MSKFGYEILFFLLSCVSRSLLLFFFLGFFIASLESDEREKRWGNITTHKKNFLEYHLNIRFNNDHQNLHHIRLQHDEDAQPDRPRAAERCRVDAADLHAVDTVRLLESAQLLPLLSVFADVLGQSQQSYSALSKALRDC